MASMILPLLFILTTALGGAPAAGRVKEVALDKEFEISVGEEVSVEGERLRINFRRVAEDSRCPEGVQCIWQGNARILLKLTKARMRAATMSLNTTLNPKQGEYRSYEVKLLKLEPYPKKNVPVKWKSYTATLVVSRK